MWRFHLFPVQASPEAGELDWLFFGLVLVTLFFLIVVFVPLLYFAVKYRRGSKADRSNPSSGSNLLETGWTLLPTLIGLGLFGWGAILYFKQQNPPADAMEIQVVGKQWMWKFQHPEGAREINELHIPTGRPVVLNMTSEDVIHDVFIPAFRVKQDVLPGKYTTEWFTPNRPGIYHLFCAEYCGTLHADMGGRVIVMEPASYERWLAEGGPHPTLAALGELRYRELGCSGCHDQQGAVRAPPLNRLFGRSVALQTGEVVAADEKYLRDSILLPASQITAGYENLMPSFQGRISEEEIMEIIAYLKSLTSSQAP
jgi:cytochrome c oxidase subunit II